MKKLILLACISLALLPASAQTGGHIILPDTFHIYRPNDFVFTSSLKSLDVIDSISDPETYFINNYSPAKGYSWLIAVKRNDKYVLFNPFMQSAYCKNFTWRRIDVDGKGHRELVIDWTFYAGHSGWTSGNHEHSGGMQIWNLDNLTRIFDLQTYYSLEQWWANHEEDTTGTLDHSEREVTSSGGEQVCESYKVTIEKESVIIQQENICPYQADTAFPVTDTKPHIYRLTKQGFIRKK